MTCRCLYFHLQYLCIMIKMHCAIIGSGNDLAPNRRQAIARTCHNYVYCRFVAVHFCYHESENADLVILVGADALMPNRHQGISYRNA